MNLELSDPNATNSHVIPQEINDLVFGAEALQHLQGPSGEEDVQVVEGSVERVSGNLCLSNRNICLKLMVVTFTDCNIIYLNKTVR